MPTAKKAAVIEELTEKLGRSNAAALIEYRGLTVTEIGALRTQLRQRDVELEVTKNTLLREAAHRNEMNDLDELFNGPTAVAFIYGDESTATKALNDYFRTARVGQIKAGILKGGRGVSAEQFAKLADLPNRETLLAQIAGLLQSPLSNLLSLFNAPAQQFAFALANFEEKGGAGIADNAGSAPAAVAEPAAPEPEVVEPTAGEPQPVAVEAVAEAVTPAAETPAPVAEPEPVVAEPEPAVEAESAAPVVEVASAAEVAASDVTSAPESEGGAEAPSADEVAADPSSAPESAGSADATV